MNPNNKANQSSMFFTIFSKRVLLALMLVGGCLTGWGQAVIMNGDYFLTHNEAGDAVNTEATDTFNPSTCLWDYASNDYIRTANSSGTVITGNHYLQYTSLSLGSDWGNWTSASNNNRIYNSTTSWLIITSLKN